MTDKLAAVMLKGDRSKKLSRFSDLEGGYDAIQSGLRAAAIDVERA